jgi:archaellum component FlaC
MIGPVPKWHIIVNFQLKPWVHYVPLKDDTSDLEEKLEWCNSNQEECERIVKNASEYISQFNEQTEQKIEKRIFEKLYENAEK